MIKKLIEVLRSLSNKKETKPEMRPNLPVQSKYKQGTIQAKDWERGYDLGLTLAHLGEGIDEAPEGESDEYYEGLQVGWLEYGYDD